LAPTDTKEEKNAGIDLKRLDPNIVEDVYNAYSTANRETKRKLMKESLRPALEDCGVHLTQVEVDLVFKQSDLNDDQCLDLGEFRAVLLTPTKLQQWAETLQLPKLLGYCLTLRVRNLEDPVRAFAGMSPSEPADTMELFSRGLRKLLAESQAELAKCYEAMDQFAGVVNGGGKLEIPNFQDEHRHSRTLSGGIERTSR
jgi:hypothetical protein